MCPKHLYGPRCQVKLPPIPLLSKTLLFPSTQQTAIYFDEPCTPYTYTVYSGGPGPGAEFFLAKRQISSPIYLSITRVAREPLYVPRPRFFCRRHRRRRTLATTNKQKTKILYGTAKLLPCCLVFPNQKPRKIGRIVFFSFRRLFSLHIVPREPSVGRITRVTPDVLSSRASGIVSLASPQFVHALPSRPGRVGVDGGLLIRFKLYR